MTMSGSSGWFWLSVTKDFVHRGDQKYPTMITWQREEGIRLRTRNHVLCGLYQAEPRDLAYFFPPPWASILGLKLVAFPFLKLAWSFAYCLVVSFDFLKECRSEGCREDIPKRMVDWPWFKSTRNLDWWCKEVGCVSLGHGDCWAGDM